MKQATTKLATLLIRASLRLNGWTDAPKPPPYQPLPQYPWWKKLTSSKIVSSDMIGAFDKVMKESNKENKS